MELNDSKKLKIALIYYHKLSTISELAIEYKTNEKTIARALVDVGDNPYETNLALDYKPINIDIKWLMRHEDDINYFFVNHSKIIKE